MFLTEIDDSRVEIHIDVSSEDVIPLEDVVKRDDVVQRLLIPYIEGDNLWDAAIGSEPLRYPKPIGRFYLKLWTVPVGI